MATILDLFKSQKKELYGNSDNIRIESKGLINPPRGAALLASSPNAIADLIGGQVSGMMKGSANRPSDTIFKGKTPFAKPISLGKTQDGLKNAIDAGTDYFVKQSPSPDSILSQLKQGASNIGGIASNLAINAVTKGGLKKLSSSLKKPKQSGFTTLTDGTQLPNYNNKNKFSKTIDVNTKWETDSIRGLEKIEKKDIDTTIKKYQTKNQIIVLFTKYGKSTTIPFEGTVTGISEDITPEWSSFKYLGSPFKVNRYQGVERSLKFELKLYYTTNGEKEIMIKKINYLKSLAFPYDVISEMKYANDTQTSQYAFSPNLVYLSIGDLYKNMFGFIDNLSFTIDDNTSWPSNFDDPTDTYMYPSVISVSVGMKIIENHKTETKDGGITKYKYNFDGRNIDSKIEETEIINQGEAQQSKKALDMLKTKGPVNFNI